MKLPWLTLAIGSACFAQSHSVKLTWQANPANPAAGIRYYPYRAAGECGAQSQEFKKLTESPVDGLTYTDLSVRPGRKYCYYVTATDGKAESTPSPTADVVIPVSPAQ